VNGLTGATEPAFFISMVFQQRGIISDLLLVMLCLYLSPQDCTEIPPVFGLLLLSGFSLRIKH
jgi:hypothetical protein